MSRKKIVIFGSTGMLGSGVVAALKNDCDLILVARNQDKLRLLAARYGPIASQHLQIIFDITKDDPRDLFEYIGIVDTAINCIGALNRAVDGELISLDTYCALNIEWPRLLSDVYGTKLIHASTDCVFDGTDGPYTESSVPSPSYGLYGYSKLFGESIADQSLVLRCCLVGEALGESKVSLLDWLRHAKGEVFGYTEWYASIITGIEFGKICLRICNMKDFPRTGLYHLAAEKVAKFDVLQKYKDLRNLECTIIPSAEKGLDKTLITDYPQLIERLEIPSLDKMLTELVNSH